MSPAGGISTGDVSNENIGAFFKYQETTTRNPVTKSYWGLTLMKKLNEEDVEMHSTFDYETFEGNRCDFTKEWAKESYDGHLPIAIMTNLERLSRADCVTAEDYKEKWMI